MPYQLLIRNHSSETLAELFTRGKCLAFQEAPFVADDQSGLPTGARLAFREEKGEMVVRNDGTLEVLLDGKAVPPGGECLLRHGNILLVAEKELRFYRLHGRPGISMTANLIGYLALAGIVLALLIEVGSVVGLPNLLKRSSGIQQQVAIQDLNSKIDAIRKRLNGGELTALVKNDPVAVAYIEALRDEMEKRTRFLRTNIDKLTAEERQAHLDNLDRLNEILDRIAANPSVSPQIPEVKIDGPVNHLIEQQ